LRDWRRPAERETYLTHSARNAQLLEAEYDLIGVHDPQDISGINGWAWGLAKTLGLLSMVAFWSAIIVGVVLLVRWLVARNAGSNDAQDPALETLRRRYAAGEISHEEYDRMLEAIERRSRRDDRH
jgi:putative membrane protein